MSKLLGHPSTHGWNINHYSCGSGSHQSCTGFSGGYDTYICGCCCHDDPSELSEQDRVTVERMRSR